MSRILCSFSRGMDRSDVNIPFYNINNISSMGASTKEKAEVIPIDTSEESIAKRRKMFRDFDINSRNGLSLADIHSGLIDIQTS